MPQKTKYHDWVLHSSSTGGTFATRRLGAFIAQVIHEDDSWFWRVMDVDGRHRAIGNEGHCFTAAITAANRALYTVNQKERQCQRN